MSDFAVNYDGMDFGSAPDQPLAVKPTTYRAYTNDGDFAGEVNMAYRGPVRVVDPANGEEVFSSTDPDAAEKAFALVNGVSKSDGRKASWAVQIDNGNGWETAAMDNIDPKKQSLLGKLADVALPILGAIFLPGFGALAALGATGGAAAGAALGSIASSVGQGRSIEEAAKRALLSAAGAGIASGVSGAIGNAAANTAGSAAGSTAGSVAGSTAANLGANAAANTIGELVVTAPVNTALQAGIGAGLGGAFGSSALAGGSGTDVVTQPTQPVQTQPSYGAELAPEVSEVVVQAVKDGASLSQLVAMGVPAAIAAGLIASSGSTGAMGTGAMTAAAVPVETVASEAAVPAGTGTAAGGAATSAALTSPAGFATTEAMLASANAALASGGIAAWIAAHPLAAAQLGLTALGALGGGPDVGANGLATGGGTPPALQQSALFKKALPAASGIFANLAPRDVSKSVTDWNKYGEGGEQSFFANVPVRANGVTPDPALVVPVTPTTPSNSSTGGGTTTGTGTTPTTPSTTVPNQATINQNLSVYGKTPGVLDLRNQPTSVNNPYAGYATTRTPPAGAVALPDNSNARFVVQDPMTAAEAEKQARLSASMAGVPTSKEDSLAVKSTGTPPQPANPPSLAVNAPTGRATDAYSAADLSRFESLSPETAASMRGINDLMARTKAAQDAAKPTNDGTMNQFQLDMAGLTKQPETKAPLGVDPYLYYTMTKAGNGMSPDEINKYNASVERAPELLGTEKMPQINSPEWFAQNFALSPKQAAEVSAHTPQFKHGGSTSKAFAVTGIGDGREDKIDAKLSDGEYVIDAETVALLGNGSSKAGADKLDKFRVNIRKHKGQKLASGKFSANAKSPEAYLAGGRR